MRKAALIALSLILGLACKKQEAPAAQAAAETNATVKGSVLERLDTGLNSYLRLKTDKGEVWVGVEKNELAPGAPVTVVRATAMRNWDSPKLGRKFDLVYLGHLEGAETAPGAPMGGMAMPHGPKGPEAPVSDVKVPKAEGAEGRSVAEVYAQKAALNGKPVAVRGKVVKVAMGITVKGISGSNWVHLQDGTGKPGEDNDLTVTTDEAVQMGDTVTLRGTLLVNPTIGSGYDRPLVLSGAKLKK